MRIFSISDIHVDYTENLKWVEGLSSFDYQNDVLIIAGDLTDKPDLLERTLTQMTHRFSKVLFVPGNHELWVQRCGNETSFVKFEKIKSIVENAGASMSPYKVRDVSIVPLFSWYDYTFGDPCEELSKVWMDFRCCEWLDYTDQDVSDYFLKMNHNNLGINDQTIISFSHFLPRIDTMPFGVPVKYQYIYPVLGSKLLDRQVRKLGANIHIYGHSHLNRKVEIDGVLYINNAFGSPAEKHIAAKSLCCIYEV